jgi:hypothetical protein
MADQYPTIEQIREVIPWACHRYVDHEHDWLKCPECLAAREIHHDFGARVSGQMICDDCGKDYYHHPQYDPEPCLTKLCNGRIVKL